MGIRNNRKNDEIRKISIQKNIMENSYSSILISCGSTKILCTASLDDTTPPFINEEKSGWLTAEYNMLPGSTPTRKSRSKIKPDSRGIEIQRIIARALRAALDLKKMKGYSIIIDCDVIQADGGTRTTSITGGYIVLEMAVRRMLKEKLINKNPIKNRIASISAGIVKNEILLDLEYIEDSQADVDFNVVMNDKGNFIELQGTGEKGDLSKKNLDKILNICEKGIINLFKIQSKVFEGNE